jgi:hypothetical protein
MYDIDGHDERESTKEAVMCVAGRRLEESDIEWSLDLD